MKGKHTLVKGQHALVKGQHALVKGQHTLVKGKQNHQTAHSNHLPPCTCTQTKSDPHHATTRFTTMHHTYCVLCEIVGNASLVGWLVGYDILIFAAAETMHQVHASEAKRSCSCRDREQQSPRATTVNKRPSFQADERQFVRECQHE